MRKPFLIIAAACLSCFLTVTALSQPVGALAREEAVRELTLEECVQYAMEHNAGLLQLRAAEAVRRIAVKEAVWAFSPSVGLSSDASFSGGRVLDPTTQQFVGTKSMASASTSLSGSVTLVEGGRKLLGWKRARADSRAAAGETEDGAFSLRLGVVEAYFAVLCAEEKRKIAGETLSRLEAQLERSKALLAAGTLTQSDVLRLNAQVYAAKSDVATAGSVCEMAQYDLWDIVGMEDGCKVRAVPPREEDATVALDLDEVVEASPAVRLARMNLEVYRLDVRLARAAAFPTLSLAAGYGSNYSSERQRTLLSPDGTLSLSAYPFGRQYADNANGYLTLRLQIPLFTSLSVKHGLDRAKLRQSHSTLAVEVARRTVRRKVVGAQSDWLLACNQHAGAEQRLHYAREAERQIQLRHNLGATDFDTWLAAMAELVEAQYNLASAKYTLMRSREILRAYAGE